MLRLTNDYYFSIMTSNKKKMLLPTVDTEYKVNFNVWKIVIVLSAKPSVDLITTWKWPADKDSSPAEKYSRYIISTFHNLVKYSNKSIWVKVFTWINKLEFNETLFIFFTVNKQPKFHKFDMKNQKSIFF